jgi:uncharacterized secreted protein with C-terminal beta-propeller domain
MTSFVRFTFHLIILTLLMSLFACSSGSGTADTTTTAVVSAKLIKSVDQADLERRIKAELKRRYERLGISLIYRYGAVGILTPTTATDASGTPTATTSTTTGSSTPQYSDTNVQEKGVDEGDLVKTDGSFIYLARGSHFLVLKAQPSDQTAIVSDIDLNEPITELYLANGKVTIVTGLYGGPVTASGASSGVATTAVMPVKSYRPLTSLSFFDVTDPTAPVQTAKYELPGAFRGSRRIGTTLYMVTNHSIDLPNPVSCQDYLPSGSFDPKAYGDACTKASEENLKRIDALTLADLVPTYSKVLYAGGVAGSPAVAPAVDWSDVYSPESGNGADLSLVFALDTSSTPPALTSSGVLSSWCRIYMSPEALYLASGNDWYWIQPLAGAAAPPANPEPMTALHKFAVGGGGQPIYRGSGMVAGWLNDQFSMGEYQGKLRIGTTRGGWFGEGISNRLAVLSEQDGKLVESGKIEGLAPGEKIYSMRFDRDRGYMVTFRQTDPLFTFDLSDPANPRTAGEIKVSGFATYIHLMGDNNNQLLTIGKSADSSGRVTGNKLQLFDVTDLATPKLAGDYELGPGWSSAGYDYHAFLYYTPLNLLAIPFYQYGTSLSSTNSGLALFTVNGSGISSMGGIPAGTVTTSYGSYSDYVDRAVVIGTDIYSIAQRNLTVAGSSVQGDIKKVVALPDGYSYQAVPVAGAATPL